MKKMLSRFTSAIIALILIAMLMPTTAFAASSDDYYTTYRNLSSSWTASSEMVDWTTDSWTKKWTTYLTGTDIGNSSFSQIVEAAYESTVAYARYNTELVNNISNVSNADLGYYVPQYTFSETLSQVAEYISEGGKAPRWTCGDYARFMTGLLRSQGIPAYIEYGLQGSTGRYHARVAAVDKANGRIYYSDPTWGVSSGDTAKWMWLTKSEYSYDYSQGYISTERMPTKRPSTDNSSGSTVSPPITVDRPSYPSAYKISIPSDCRYENVVVPITKNGKLIANVPMRVIWYDGAWWFTARDACMVLNETSRSAKVAWDSAKNTIVFSPGTYSPNGTETNWTDGKSLAINKTAQAYMLPPAFFGSEQTNIRVISIDGVTFVRPVDIAKMMDFGGSVTTENQLGGNIKIQ